MEYLHKIRDSPNPRNASSSIKNKHGIKPAWLGIYSPSHKPGMLFLGDASPAANALNLSLFAAGDAIVALPVFSKEIMDTYLDLAKMLAFVLRDAKWDESERCESLEALAQIPGVDSRTAGRVLFEDRCDILYVEVDEEVRLYVNNVVNWLEPKGHLLLRYKDVGDLDFNLTSEILVALTLKDSAFGEDVLLRIITFLARATARANNAQRINAKFLKL